MSNNQCPVGAANAADIKNLQRSQKEQGDVIRRVEDKIDKINWWLVALLGGMVVSLALQIAGRVGG